MTTIDLKSYFRNVQNESKSLIPGTLTEQNVDNGVTAEEEYERVYMAYDESGSRIWQNVVNKGHMNRTEATLSGVGVYVKEDFISEFELGRLDLIGGGFRQGKTGDAQGAAGAAVGGAINYAGNTVVYNRNFDAGEFLSSTITAAVVGGLVGGIMGGVQYKFSDAYQWKTHETVLEYANGKNDDYELLRAAEYVKAIEGGNKSTPISFIKKGVGKSNYNYEFREIFIDNNDFLQNGKFSASKFYSAVAHEIRHEPLYIIDPNNPTTYNDWAQLKSFDESGYYMASQTQEKIINQQLMQHRYFNYWDNASQMRIHNSYNRVKDFNHDWYFNWGF
jgi:hypothetical protein